jgi:Flp pilus assembly protein TadG
MRFGPVLRRFFCNRKANVAITFAFAMIPTVYLAGMTIDYISATRKQAKLDALADGAVLAALTPAMLHSTDAVARQAALNFFNSQASSTQGLNYNTSTQPAVTITDTITTRTVALTYTAQSDNFFPGVLNLASITLSGTSQASASFPPNIDFYLLLDNSGSMAIPATQAGINSMMSATAANQDKPSGCAFACHEANPSGDGLNNVNPSTGKVDPNLDNYTLALDLGITTRIQLVGSAVTQLATTASQTAQVNQATYRMGLYTFNAYVNNTQSNMQVVQLTSNLSSISNLPAGTIDVMEVYQNNDITKGNSNDDEDTDFDSAMSVLNGIMPAPGTGLSGSTPQEVLFIVTDGVDDANTNNMPASCTGSSQGSNRCMEAFSNAWCTSIKNRGIRIAVLYTVYLPMTADNWYNTYIAPIQQWNSPAGNDNFANNMQNCASPGLYASVTTNGDIAAALNNLFQQAVQEAHLTQ